MKNIYTMRDLVRIQMEAQQLAEKAMEMQGLLVYQCPPSTTDAQELQDGLQAIFSRLHANVLGDMEEVQESTSQAVQSPEKGSKPQGLACFPVVARELGEQGAIDELQKVIDAGIQVHADSEAVNSSFIWAESPQGNGFWCSRFTDM